MKLFTVEGHYDYEGFTILGIFTSKELAEEALIRFKEIRAINNSQYDDYQIGEFKADKLYY